MENKKSILITGSSTGIGKASALKLDKEGFQVFAGVRKKSDGDALKKLSTGNLIPLIIDVTDVKSIEKACKTISTITDGNLYGLMNNAGIAANGVVELMPLDFVKNVIETNLISIFAVTRIFMPLLRKSKGRIVNTGSISGITALPGMSVYAASKFGMEAFSQSLRLEVRPFGISVSVLEPGAIATEIWGKGQASRKEIISKSDPEIIKLYEKLSKSFEEKFETMKFLQPEDVAKKVFHAFTSKKPKRHYLIGDDAKSWAFIESLPEGLRDWIFYKKIYK
jgi:NAD(P)-dependent dehydrogenase (short-subunit alcohol dehydrogenase family)